MKKIFFAVAAFAALTFASCDNKTNGNANGVDSVATDSIEAVASDAGATADAVISELTSQLDAKDAGAIEKTLATIKEKIADLLNSNPEAAKEYVSKVQTFLKDNADKIKGVVGDNAAVTSAVAALTAAPAEDVVNNIKNTLGAAKDAGSEAVGNAVDAVKNAPEAAKDAAESAANKAVEDAKSKAAEKVDNAKKDAGAAIDKAASDAKKKLGL